jgi:hypothetical protein
MNENLVRYSKFGHNKWLRDDTNENCDQSLALDSVFKY